MGKKFEKRFTGIVLTLFLMILLSVPVSAAAAKMNDLGYSDEPSRVYTEYDLNGDGTADRLSIELGNKSEGGDYMRLVIRINGKAALTRKYSVEGTFGIKAKILKLANGKTYLFIADALMNDYVGLCSLFRYNGTKLVKSYDFRTLGGLLWHTEVNRVHGDPTAVSGNTISFTESFQTPALANTKTQLKLVYKGGKLQLSSRYGKISAVSGKNPAGKKYKLLKDVTVYPTGTSTTPARTLQKGSLLKISKFCIANGTLRFRVVDSAGRSGYVNALDYSEENGVQHALFEGLYYS